MAVVEDGKIVDFSMTCESQKTLVNDIYRGKVVNLEPAIGAAFGDGCGPSVHDVHSVSSQRPSKVCG